MPSYRDAKIKSSLTPAAGLAGTFHGSGDRIKDKLARAVAEIRGMSVGRAILAA
jgi:hypothetical protein